MQGFRYLENAITLQLDAEKCNGCRGCVSVCPHGVFAIGEDKRAYLADRGACMECGACALNCQTGAITLEPGVGCAAAIIRGWVTGTEPSCGCSGAPGPTPVGAEPGAAAPAAAGSCCGSDAGTAKDRRGCC